MLYTHQVDHKNSINWQEKISDINLLQLIGID